MSRLCCMCGEVGAFRPRHHADCDCYELLKPRSCVMAWGKIAGIGGSQLEKRHGSQSDTEGFRYESLLLHVR
jgi:hypothetical protein